MVKILVIALEYNNLPNYRLKGCYNDALNFIDTIKYIRNVSDSDITFMNDNDYKFKEPLFPSKSNIIKQIKKLSQSQDKLFYVYMAGHGTTQTDYNNDESELKSAHLDQIIDLNSENKDSCLVTNDIYKINVITDDTLNIMFSFFKKDTNIVGIMDMCHSGTIFDLKYLYLPILEDNKYKMLSGVYNKKPVKANITLFGGTRDNALAYEMRMSDKVNGVFTHSFCKVLRSVMKMNRI